MKVRSVALLIAAATTLLQTPNARAQATNPPYLREMPTVERVKAEIKGTDAIDTAARQAGAFWQLRDVIYKMALSQHRNDRQVTSDEKRLADAYYAAWYSVWQPVQKALAHERPRLFKLEGYTADPDVLSEVLERLSSAAFRAEYYKAVGLVDTRKQIRKDAARTEQQQQAQAKAPASRANVPPSAASSSVPPLAADVVDSDVIKAKGAKVDTRVAGIQIGEPFRFSDCNLLDVRPKSVCIPIDEAGWFGEVVRDLQPDADPNIKTVMLPNDNCPTWTPTNCRAYITLYQGRIVGVALLTKGRGVVTAAKAELQEKYGRPTGFNNATVTPDEGNSFKVSDPEWILPGIHVEFETVLKDGDRVNLSNGVVRIETASAYARRLQKSKTVKKKL